MKTIKIILCEIWPLLVCGRMRCAYMGCLVLLVMACGKDEDWQPFYEDGKSTVIYDLAGDTEASMGDGVDGKDRRDFNIFLFRFRDGRQIWVRNAIDSATWLPTKEWDLAFTGPYNSEVFVNNTYHEFNPGYGGEAKHSAVILIRQPYEAVHVAPSDEEFDASDVNKIGWAASDASYGWFRYSLQTHIMQALPNRTYVMRLPDGKYGKLQLINAYKGNPEAVTNMNWPAPYYTFRYFVQQDGSRNLDTSP